MLRTELHLLVFILIISHSTINAIAGRCYLCSEATLVECAGSNQLDSSIYTTVLQYYTEPCNGQCVLFRNENRSIIRGCSWTYGHMTSKSIGWHEISPSIQAYFCDSHLCNNGTYEQPDLSIRNHIILSPQELFILAGKNPSWIQTGQYFPRRLHQCYSCTSRFQGCGEYIDPYYSSNYIRPCPSSCIIFRNPNDLNLITRDCSIFWPKVHAKSGLQKLLGSDAFFCQESLCNGINFDFIMGIFHNQVPVGITFSPIPIKEHVSIATSAPTIKTTIDIFNDNVIWDDPDLDDGIVESTTPVISNNFTTSSTPINHFDFSEEIRPNSTSVGGLSIVQSNSSFNWWDFNDTSLSSSPLTSTLTIPIEDDDWIISNTSSTLPITRFEHLSIDDTTTEDYHEEIDQTTEDLFTFYNESNSDIDVDANDYIFVPSLTTTPSVMDLINNNNTQPLNPYNIIDTEIKDQLLEYIKPFPTLAMPPFSWMLNIANQNRSEVRNSTTTTTTTTTTEKQEVQLTTTTSKAPNVFFEYCKNKQCSHGGRLNSDCLCICLPAFTGDNCETVLCEQEPVHLCAFVLEHECEIDHIRYLCPKYCQMNNCSTTILSNT